MEPSVHYNSESTGPGPLSSDVSTTATGHTVLILVLPAFLILYYYFHDERIVKTLSPWTVWAISSVAEHVWQASRTPTRHLLFLLWLGLRSVNYLVITTSGIILSAVSSVLGFANSVLLFIVKTIWKLGVYLLLLGGISYLYSQSDPNASRVISGFLCRYTPLRYMLELADYFYLSKLQFLFLKTLEMVTARVCRLEGFRDVIYGEADVSNEAIKAAKGICRFDAWSRCEIDAMTAWEWWVGRLHELRIWFGKL
jgi:hypothetical protein